MQKTKIKICCSGIERETTVSQLEVNLSEMVWFRLRSMVPGYTGKKHTDLSQVIDKHATVRPFSLGTPVSTTYKTDRHDITEILLTVALNT